MQSPRLARRRSLLTGALLPLAAWHGSAWPHPPEAAIAIDNFTFAPASLTIAAGTSVVWTNHDDIPHTVVGVEDPRALRSPPLDTDDRYAFTFTAPGTYRYFCSLHPHMQGLVMVR